MTGYIKIRFRSKYGETAGIVLAFERYDAMTVTELSRLFPMSECLKMGYLEKSPVFESWDNAFLFDFDDSRSYVTRQTVNPLLVGGIR